MQTYISISESEWVVMKIIWNEPPKTLQDILSELKHMAWSSTTIQTYLARLVKKGALATKRQGKGYLYYPAISESDCQLAGSKSFLGILGQRNHFSIVYSDCDWRMVQNANGPDV